MEHLVRRVKGADYADKSSDEIESKRSWQCCRLLFNFTVDSRKRNQLLHKGHIHFLVQRFSPKLLLTCILYRKKNHHGESSCRLIAKKFEVNFHSRLQTKF